MSVAVPFIVAAVVGFGTSKIVTSLTGNETLGMIAGMAVGGMAGGYAGGAAGGGTGGTGATAGTATPAGSSGAGGVGGSAVPTTNYLPLPQSSGGLTTGTGQGLLSAQGPGITQGATTAGVSSGAAGTAPGAAIASTPSGSTGLLSKLGLTATDAWNIGGNIAKGYGEFKMRGKELDILDDRQQLAEDKLKQEQLERDQMTAHGVSRGGDRVPLNIDEQLAGVNQGSSLTGLNTLGTVQRTEAGYLSGFGRFNRPEEKVA